MIRQIRSADMILLFVMLSAFRSASAQGIVVPTQRLESTIDTVRINAFAQLQAEAYDPRHRLDRPPTSFLADSAKVHPELASALIQLLQRENAYITAVPSATLPPGFLGGYYMDLKVTVARIGAPASTSALLGGIGVSGPVDAALASFGDGAVTGVLAQLQSADVGRHEDAVVILAAMVQARSQNHLSDASTALIQAALLSEVEDSRSMMREPAIRGLMPLSSQAIRAVMERVAASDTTPARHEPNSPIIYGVRDAARAWLAAHPD